MKSVFISFIMFAAVLLAMYFGLFEKMSSVYAYALSILLLLVVLGFALKILGLPFAKDKKHDSDKS